MWELDHKESWAPKSWCFWTVVLEKTLEIPLNCKEIKPANPKGNKPDYSLEGLKLKFQYFGHLMQIDEETVETVSDFIFGGFKITADGDCSNEIKRCLILGRKVMTNLDSIFKSRDITLPTKVHLVKAMVFPVVMYGCESWTVKKAESWKIDAFF